MHMEEWESNQVDLDDLLKSNTTARALFVLRHWIDRNSFISQHAQWRVTIEDLAKDPLHTWMLCLEVGRDDCPNLSKIRSTLQSMDHSKNHNGKIAEAHLDDLVWWQRLAMINEGDVKIALKMAQEYGYQLNDRLEEIFQISSVRYACRFGNDAMAGSERELPRRWGCSLA
jgi:hypothetical protein